MATTTYTLLDKYRREKEQQQGTDRFKLAVPRDDHNLHYRNDLAVGMSDWTAYNKRVFGLFTLAPIEEQAFIGIFTGVNTIEERLDKSFESPDVQLTLKNNAGGTDVVTLNEKARKALQKDVDRYSASLPIPVTMASSGSALTNTEWPQTPVQNKQVYSVLHKIVSVPRLVLPVSQQRQTGALPPAQIASLNNQQCDLLGMCNHARSDDPACNCALVLASVPRYEHDTDVNYLFLALVALRPIGENEELRWAYGYNPLGKWKPSYNPGVQLTSENFVEATFHRNEAAHAHAYGHALVASFRRAFKSGGGAKQPTVLEHDAMLKYATAVVAFEPCWNYEYVARWVPSQAMQPFGTYTPEDGTLPNGEIDPARDETLATLLKHIVPVAIP